MSTAWASTGSLADAEAEVAPDGNADPQRTRGNQSTDLHGGPRPDVIFEPMEQPPHVSRIADLVAYQDGSVVSRIIIKRETGNVTLFAFDQGQELSEHTTPYDALVQVVEGDAEIRIAGTPYRLRAGEMIIMPAHQPHAVRATSRFKMLLTMIRS